MDLSMQLYSIRNEGTFEEIIKKLYAMHYSGIELVGYFNLEPPHMKDILLAYNMSVVGNHISIEQLEDNLQNEMEYNSALNNKNIVVTNCFFETENEMKKLVSRLYKIGNTLISNGFKLFYHNHDFEFRKIGNRYLIELLNGGEIISNEIIMSLNENEGF